MRPRMPLLALIWSSASWAPISSFLPSAAKVPVSGLSRPILTGSSASDFTTNGLATCRAPIARPALSSVRRRTGRLMRLDMFTPSGAFLVVSEGRAFMPIFYRPINQTNVEYLSYNRGKCNANAVARIVLTRRSQLRQLRYLAGTFGSGTRNLSQTARSWASAPSSGETKSRSPSRRSRPKCSSLSSAPATAK